MSQDERGRRGGSTPGYLPDPGPALVQGLSSATQQIACYLDEEEFSSFLAFFSDDARYRITAFSSELRKEVAYLDLDRHGLETLGNGIGDHVRFPNKLIRHVSRPMIRESEANRVSCTSKVAIYHVDPKGVGGLYAVANYQDRFELTAGAGPLLLSRNVALETRTLPFGSHVPL